MAEVEKRLEELENLSVSILELIQSLKSENRELLQKIKGLEHILKGEAEFYRVVVASLKEILEELRKLEEEINGGEKG